MNDQIKAFLAAEAFAIIGVSRSKNKFGNTIFHEMRAKGFDVHPVHPELPAIDGVNCVKEIAALPDKVGSAIIVVHPEDAVKILAQCHTRGINNVWLQQGAESDEAIAFAREHSMNLVHGRCVLMFTEPVKSIHAVHRWFSKVTGNYPA